MNDKWERTRDALKDLIDILSCSICKKNLQFLKCGHFFCISCVDNGRTACLQCGVDATNGNFGKDETLVKIIKACHQIAREVQLEPQRNSSENKQEIKSENVPSNGIDSNDNLDVSMKDLSLNNNNDTKIIANALVKKPGKKSKKRKGGIGNNNYDIPKKPKLDKFSKALENPKKINKRNHKGETLLLEACRKNRLDIVCRYLEAGADPNIPCFAGWTPLQECVDYNFVEVVEVLLIEGADVNKIGFEGRTALHEAAKNNNVDLINLLLTYGAKKNIFDNNKKLPVDYCVTYEARSAMETNTEEQENTEGLILDQNIENSTITTEETTSSFKRTTKNSLFSRNQEDTLNNTEVNAIKNENTSQEVEIVYENIVDQNIVDNNTKEKLCALQESLPENQNIKVNTNNVPTKDAKENVYNDNNYNDLKENINVPSSQDSSILKYMCGVYNSSFNVINSSVNDNEEYIDIIN